MKYKDEIVEVEELQGKTIIEIAYKEFDIYYHTYMSRMASRTIASYARYSIVLLSKRLDRT